MSILIEFGIVNNFSVLLVDERTEKLTNERKDTSEETTPTETRSS